MATDRAFQLAKVPVDGIGARTAMRIFCSSCTNKLDFVQTGASRKPPEAARQYFQRHGWEVGHRRAKDDVCPDCIARRSAEAARRPKLSLVPVVKVDGEGIIHHDLEIRGNTDMAQIVARTEQPRIMGIDDRRIVFEAVSDHYVDPKTGYEKGWSDKKIGEHLGVPWAWAKEVRELMFGPEGNEEAAAIRAELDKLAAEAGALTKQIATHQGELSRINGHISLLIARIDKM